MKPALVHVTNAFKVNPIKAIITALALFATGFIAFNIVAYFILEFFPYRFSDWIFRSSLLSLATFIGVVILTLYLSRRLPFLSWFWFSDGKKEKPAEPSIAEATNPIQKTFQSNDIPVPLRKTPKGTRLSSAGYNGADFEIKAAIRFWFWFLPLLFGSSAAVIGAPLGAYIGFSIYRNHPRSYALNPLDYIASGVFWGVGAFLLAAIVSYTLTRPWVRVAVRKDSIIIRGNTYDRKHHFGMRIGYQVQDETGLKNDFFDQSLGLSAIRLTYGRWGEDLPYLVNKYHAPEIVIWMNELINAVGAPAPAANAPSEGRREQSF